MIVLDFLLNYFQSDKELIPHLWDNLVPVSSRFVLHCNSLKSFDEKKATEEC